MKMGMETFPPKLEIISLGLLHWQTPHPGSGLHGAHSARPLEGWNRLPGTSSAAIC